MGWRDHNRVGRRWLLFILIAVLAQLAFFGMMSQWTRPSEDTSDWKEPHALRGTMIPIKPKANAADAWKGQIVDLKKPAHEQTPPDNARFLSQYDSRVEHETKARSRGLRRAEQPGLAQDKKAAAPTPSHAVSKESVEPATQPNGLDRPKTPDGARALRTNGLAGADKVLLPTVDGRSAMRNMQALGGGFVSDDALMDVPDEGDETLLNARSFKYFDYFQRVRERVRQEWDPSTVYSGRDPYGKVYGQKDRLTVLNVTLDDHGLVQRLSVQRESGLPFLDSEAIRAFREAGPFPNPPKGLADENGRISFRFGFMLEVGASAFKFFWQRPE